MDVNNRKRIILYFVAACVAVAGLCFFVVRHHQSAVIQVQTPSSTGLPFATSRADHNGTVTVYVTGRVIHSGMLQVPKNSRVEQVIALAGGFAPGADQDKVNLAAKIKDGQHIHVPAVKDSQQRVQHHVGGKQGDDRVMTSDSSFVRMDDALPPDQSNVKLNINRATIQDLDKLSGIGDVLAKRIVQYRDQHGRFHTIDDLHNVQGMTHSRIQKIRPFIVVE